MNNKKIITMLLCFGVFFAISINVGAEEPDIDETDTYIGTESPQPTTVYIYSDDAMNTGDLISPVETMDEQLSLLSEEQKDIAYEKFIEMEDNNEITSYAITWKYLSGFTMFKQSQSYYCVVASCKAAMQYITGSSDAQSTIASALGTTTSGTPFANARTYLNNNQTRNVYVSKDANTSQSEMENNFYSAINRYDAPPLISVKLSTTDGWEYDTSGHTMCISGARSDKLYFRVADPYIQWVDATASMSYFKSSSSIHTAILDRGNGYIY